MENEEVKKQSMKQMVDMIASIRLLCDTFDLDYFQIDREAYQEYLLRKKFVKP